MSFHNFRLGPLRAAGVTCTRFEFQFLLITAAWYLISKANMKEPKYPTFIVITDIIIIIITKQL